MQYDDFATADPANAPLNAPILIGAQPAFWLAVLAFVLAVAVLAWLLGRRSASSTTDACDAIWRAIDDDVKAAMKADGDALPGRAATLKRTIEARLGDTLALGGGLGLDALDHALDGHAAPDHGHGHGDHATHREPDGHSTPDHGGPHGDESHGRPNAATASGASANVTIIVPPAATATGDHGHGGHGGHGSTPLSVAERNRALRNAVADINERWRHKDQRIAEMRGALRELSGA